MPSTRRAHQGFIHQGEFASYLIENGWMRVTWDGWPSALHEVKATPTRELAMMLLVQMPEWKKKYPADGFAETDRNEGP